MSKPVTTAVSLFAVSLLYRIYSEAGETLSILETGAYPPYQVGRVTILFVYYLFQAFLLWKVMRRRKWARIALAVVVVLNILLGLAIVFALSGSPVAVLVLSSLEVAAIGLLIASGEFRSRQANAA